MFRNELRSRYGGMVGSAVHDHIIIAAPHLADGACVHAPVWAGYKRDFESLCIHKVPQRVRMDLTISGVSSISS